MTTLLAHIRIKPGSEPQWEAIMADMNAQTWGTETSVKRYEYWKGEEPNLYYCLLSFDDKWAFYRHQMSPHHEGHDFAAVLEGIRLEYLDPVKGAGGGLPQTLDPALPENADSDLLTAQERFPSPSPHGGADGHERRNLAGRPARQGRDHRRAGALFAHARLAR